MNIGKEHRQKKYWVCDELSFSQVFCLDFKNGECAPQIKSDRFYIRPVLALKVK